MISLLVALGVLVVVAAAMAAVRAATRLDRLHVRTDAAWLALDGALRRRAVVVRTMVAAGAVPGSGGAAPPPASGELAVAANRAVAGDPDRETAENQLGRALGTLDRTRLDAALAVELADAEARVVIARRVYNDAVRDTLALRSRRAVHWLRLAGTAPEPRYFEIVEPDGVAVA